MIFVGRHCKIANLAIGLMNGDFDGDAVEPIPLNDINRNIIKLAQFFPTVTFEWCYFLTLLNYNNRKFWSSILQITETYGIVKQL